MPKIPRSEYSFAYTPSKPPMVPLSLADMSAWTDALDKGAAFAAKMYHKKVDEEAKLSINSFANSADNLVKEWDRRPYEDQSTVESGGKPLSLEERSTNRNNDFKKSLDDATPSEKMQSGWGSRHRVALESAKQNAISQHEANTRLKESQTLVSAHRANAKNKEAEMISHVRDIHYPISQIHNEVKAHWELRLQEAGAGGLMENPEQARTAELVFRSKYVLAMIDRWESAFIGKMGPGGITSADDLRGGFRAGKDPKDISAGIFDSYQDFHRALKSGHLAGHDLKGLFPDKNPRELAHESHNRIMTALTTKRTARETVAKRTFNGWMNHYMKLAFDEERDFTEAEASHLDSLALLSGSKISAHVFNLREKWRLKPTRSQQEFNRQLELDFHRIIDRAVEYGVEPDFGPFSTRLMNGLDEKRIHAGDAMGLYKKLSDQRGQQGKRINAAIKDIKDKVITNYYIKPSFSKSGTRKRTSKEGFEIYNQELSGDIDRAIRNRVRAEILKSGNQPPDLHKVYLEVVDDIEGTRRSREPLTINIGQDELESVYSKKSKGGNLSPSEQLTFDLSIAKMERNARFKRNSKEFVERAAKMGKASKMEIAKFKDDPANKLSLKFLKPGDYSYENLYNKYFGPASEKTVVPKKEDSVSKPVDRVETGDETIEGDSTVVEETAETRGEFIFDDNTTVRELLTAFQRNPREVWDAIPDGHRFKESLRPLLFPADGAVVSESESATVKSGLSESLTGVPEEDVHTFQEDSGKFETSTDTAERIAAEQKEAAIRESVVVETGRDVLEAGKNALDFVSRQVKALGSAKEKGQAAMDEYIKSRDRDKYPFWQLKRQVGDLLKAGHQILAKQLDDEVNAFMAALGYDYKRVSVPEKEVDAGISLEDQIEDAVNIGEIELPVLPKLEKKIARKPKNIAVKPVKSVKRKPKKIAVKPKGIAVKAKKMSKRHLERLDDLQERQTEYIIFSAKKKSQFSGGKKPRDLTYFQKMELKQLLEEYDAVEKHNRKHGFPYHDITVSKKD
tara:strand:+ start:679 stop:3747 length:3069 start_codon:yes stop_codon:yes gene_type:complete